MIEFNDVSYAYAQENVLRRVSFRVKKGECVFLTGPNGAGKSTLLKIINGLCFPFAGQYLFEGTEINSRRLKDKQYAKLFHQKIGYVWQNPDAQLFCGSVEDEIAFGPRQMGLTEAETMRRVEDALMLFDLAHLRHRPPYWLSGGEKKKAAIAAVFVMNPAVWTLDEPLNSLDRKTQEFLAEFLKKLKEAGKTIVFSSHEQNLAQQTADFELRLDESHEISQHFF